MVFAASFDAADSGAVTLIQLGQRKADPASERQRKPEQGARSTSFLIVFAARTAAQNNSGSQSQ